MTVVSQSGASNDGGTPPAGGDGDGGQGDGTGKPNPGDGGQGGNGGQALDFTKMSAADIEKALENPNLWQNPRMKELLESQKELKTLKESKAAADEQTLKDQKKFEELADNRGKENESLKAQIQTMTQNQALTNALVKAGVVDVEGALLLADRSKLTIDDAGKVSGIDETVESLKTARSYLFTSSGDGNQSLGGTPPGGGGGDGGGNTPMKFKRSQLKDPEFYKAHEKEIDEAYAKGLIEDDISPSK